MGYVMSSGQETSRHEGNSEQNYGMVKSLLQGWSTVRQKFGSTEGTIEVKYLGEWSTKLKSFGEYKFHLGMRPNLFFHTILGGRGHAR